MDLNMDPVWSTWTSAGLASAPPGLTGPRGFRAKEILFVSSISLFFAYLQKLPLNSSTLLCFAHHMFHLPNMRFACWAVFFSTPYFCVFSPTWSFACSLYLVCMLFVVCQYCVCILSVRREYFVCLWFHAVYIMNALCQYLFICRTYLVRILFVFGL